MATDKKIPPIIGNIILEKSLSLCYIIITIAEQYESILRNENKVLIFSNQHIKNGIKVCLPSSIKYFD